MMPKRQFKKLRIWEKSHLLTLEIYKISSKFPKSEDFILSSQIKRAASSVPANIAEGCVKSLPSFINHLSIAQGSLEEVKYFLLLAFDLCYIEESSYKTLVAMCEESGKMIYSFMNKLRADS